MTDILDKKLANFVELRSQTMTPFTVLSSRQASDRDSTTVSVSSCPNKSPVEFSVIDETPSTNKSFPLLSLLGEPVLPAPAAPSFITRSSSLPYASFNRSLPSNLSNNFPDRAGISLSEPIGNSSPVTQIEPDLAADLRRGIETDIRLQGYEQNINTSHHTQHIHSTELSLLSDRVLQLELTKNILLDMVNDLNAEMKLLKKELLKVR